MRSRSSRSLAAGTPPSARSWTRWSQMQMRRKLRRLRRQVNRLQRQADLEQKIQLELALLRGLEDQLYPSQTVELEPLQLEMAAPDWEMPEPDLEMPEPEELEEMPDPVVEIEGRLGLR